eukprot:2562383-Rhodomonas_salina.2
MPKRTAREATRVAPCDPHLLGAHCCVDATATLETRSLNPGTPSPEKEVSCIQSSASAQQYQPRPPTPTPTPCLLTSDCFHVSALLTRSARRDPRDGTAASLVARAAAGCLWALGARAWLLPPGSTRRSRPPALTADPPPLSRVRCEQSLMRSASDAISV